MSQTYFDFASISKNQKLNVLGFTVFYREEVIAYYSQLTEEAAHREQKALWRVRRGRLELERSEFLLQQERQWAADLERAKQDPVSF